MPLPQSRWSRHDVGMVVVSLIWGANFSANKYALGSVGPLAFSAARFVLASGLLWLAVRVLARGAPIPRAVAWRIAGLGVVGNTAYQALFMTGLDRTTAINGALIMAALPIMVAVMGTVSGVEHGTPRLWWGMVIATVGVALVIAAQGLKFSAATLGGDLRVLVACSCWAAFTIGIRHYGRGLDPIRVTAISTYGGTPGLVLLGLPQLSATDWTALPPGAYAALLYSSVLALVVAYLLWSYAVQGIGGNRTAIYNSAVPVFAAIVAWYVLGERMLAGQAAGAALVFVGVFLSVSGSSATPAVVTPDPS